MLAILKMRQLIVQRRQNGIFMIGWSIFNLKKIEWGKMKKCLYL
ncbi:hypothetical protein GARC_3498 [Paraglaciecola arctica BSs20135]|uniref:Uncharacterized protein n=1 Tax=Paraglaciecola arctica BSs20135 TaxID=493475 RepID=K6YUS3_9ALTE|nr:hypothetical protein GARC_3498 [Paraglaciecola arctica BSs20135]